MTAVPAQVLRGRYGESTLRGKRITSFRAVGRRWFWRTPRLAWSWWTRCGRSFKSRVGEERWWVGLIFHVVECLPIVWKPVCSSSGPLPVALYNCLLAVYLQNGFQFDPIEFMENMEKEGVAPNQVWRSPLLLPVPLPHRFPSLFPSPCRGLWCTCSLPTVTEGTWRGPLRFSAT